MQTSEARWDKIASPILTSIPAVRSWATILPALSPTMLLPSEYRNGLSQVVARKRRRRFFCRKLGSRCVAKLWQPLHSGLGSIAAKFGGIGEDLFADNLPGFGIGAIGQQHLRDFRVSAVSGMGKRCPSSFVTSLNISALL